MSEPTTPRYKIKNHNESARITDTVTGEELEFFAINDRLNACSERLALTDEFLGFLKSHIAAGFTSPRSLTTFAEEAVRRFSNLETDLDKQYKAEADKVFKEPEPREPFIPPKMEPVERPAHWDQTYTRSEQS